MRRYSLILSLSAVLLVMGMAGSARAAIVSTGGPNPSWTDMQQYEWYIGYVARAAQMCGAYDDAVVLTRLARMSPYGAIGLTQDRADGFLGGACARLRNKAADMVVDAAKLEAYIETTYNCTDESCFGQKISDWQFHDCANSLKSDFEILDIDSKDIRAVTMINPSSTGSDAAYQARVQFHSCQGSLYIDLSEQCVMEKKLTRGDCQIEGVDRY